MKSIMTSLDLTWLNMASHVGNIFLSWWYDSPLGSPKWYSNIRGSKRIALEGSRPAGGPCPSGCPSSLNQSHNLFDSGAGPMEQFSSWDIGLQDLAHFLRACKLEIFCHSYSWGSGNLYILTFPTLLCIALLCSTYTVICLPIPLASIAIHCYTWGGAYMGGGQREIVCLNRAISYCCYSLRLFLLCFNDCCKV